MGEHPHEKSAGSAGLGQEMSKGVSLLSASEGRVTSEFLALWGRVGGASSLQGLVAVSWPRTEEGIDGCP